MHAATRVGMCIDASGLCTVPDGELSNYSSWPYHPWLSIITELPMARSCVQVHKQDLILTELPPRADH